MTLDDFTRDKQTLYTQLIQAGATPAKKNSFICPFHNDKTPSSWIKKSEVSGRWYWKCAVCQIRHDAISLAALNEGKDVKDFIAEKFGNKAEKFTAVYKTLEDLVHSIDGIIEEVNKYTNPETGNHDLITIRYYERGGDKKAFAQAYQTPSGYIRRKPKYKLPIFNRIRVKDAEAVIVVEGEACVRKLTELGFIATTSSGGSGAAGDTDWSYLSGKTVYLWPDLNPVGEKYIETIAQELKDEKLLKVNASGFDLPEGGDVVDLYDKILQEGGTVEDVSACIESLLDEAQENNPLEGYEVHLQEMRDGTYVNLPIKDFPILTSEARMLLNKRIGIVYGNAGFGKSLMVGKMSDDLKLDGIDVIRLCLEDEHHEHLKRSHAQQLQRAELVKEDWHRANPEASQIFYEQCKDMLTTLSSTIVAGENDAWDVDKILAWIDYQLSQGKELVIVDPISVIMTKDVWITSHKLMWGAKRILAKYPNGRVVFVGHNNSEGEVAGGMSFRRFSHAMFMLNRYKKPKKVLIADNQGETSVIEMHRSIGIEKSRYGSGQGLEIAVTINPSTLCMDELGIVLEILKDKPSTGKEIITEEIDL